MFNLGFLIAFDYLHSYLNNYFFLYLSLFLCSGMLVQDPTRRNNVDSIFEQARVMGAQQVPLPSFDGQSSSSTSFTGTGRLLSGDAQIAPAAPQPPQDVLHNIHFWNNGFTVDDGPLRGYDDPANADFIEVTMNLFETFWAILVCRVPVVVFSMSFHHFPMSLCAAFIFLHAFGCFKYRIYI